MSKQFSTPNQGVAAYLLSQGGEVVDVEKRSNTYNGQLSERVYFVFNIDNEAGKKIASQFYDKVSTIEPNDYYENLKSLRTKLWDARKQKTEVEV